MRVQSLVWEDPLEEGMATHSSIAAWRIPWTEEPGELWPIGLQTQLKRLSTASIYIVYDYSLPSDVQMVKNLPAVQETQV